MSDARRFLEFSFDNGDPMHAGYVLMLVLGLRRGELLGLRWDDIDLEKDTAQIRSQLLRIDGRLVLRPTKTISSGSGAAVARALRARPCGTSADG